MNRDYIASIDPGKHACGVAVWHQESSMLNWRLLWASWVKNPYKIAEKERAARWGDMGRAVAASLERWKPWGVSLVLEIPQIYEGPQEEKKDDLIDLAGVQGAVVAATGFDVDWSPRPREWKGQLPKEISKARVESKLSAAEKALVEWPAESYRHNVYDALHLGLVHLEREGLR